MADVKTFSWDEVKKHTSTSSCWIVYKEGVYDITDFLEDHPGGDDVLKDAAGTDSTQVFDDIGHSPEAEEQMEEYRIGNIEKSKSKADTSGGSNIAAKTSSADGTSIVQRIAIPLVLVVLAFALNQYWG